MTHEEHIERINASARWCDSQLAVEGQAYARELSAAATAYAEVVRQLRTAQAENQTLRDQLQGKNDAIAELRKDLETEKRHWVEDERDLDTLEKERDTAQADVRTLLDLCDAGGWNRDTIDKIDAIRARTPDGSANDTAAT